MRGRQYSCCFTGHRPGKLPWGYAEEDPRCRLLKQRIADAVEGAYQDAWPADQRERYRRLVKACDFETVVSQQYSASCMQRRDRYMVDHAALLVAAFDGSPGGTRYTVEYAMRRGLEIVDLPIPGA